MQRDLRPTSPPRPPAIGGRSSVRVYFHHLFSNRMFLTIQKYFNVFLCFSVSLSDGGGSNTGVDGEGTCVEKADASSETTQRGKLLRGFSLTIDDLPDASVLISL